MSNKQNKKATDKTKPKQDQLDEATTPKQPDNTLSTQQKATDKTESQQDKKTQAPEDILKRILRDDAITDQQVASDTAQPQQAQTEDNIDMVALLAAARKQADNYKNDMLRAHADMENLRRRQARDLENAHKRALDKFVEELLPICDSMALGIKAADTSDATLTSVRDGMEMTMKMFVAAIAKFGLEEVNPQENDAFNPDLHQAMQTQDKEGVPAGQIVMVVQKGYQLNGRLLRPAMVIVSA